MIKKYYKVSINSEEMDLSKYKQNIIVKRGLIYAKEILTNTKLMICENKTQGSMHDFYVLSSDLEKENIARYDDVKEYLDNFKLTEFPICSSYELKKSKKLVKNSNRNHI